MKKIITTFLLSGLFAFSAFAQPVFEEDFETSMPSSFIIIDGDGNTVAANISHLFPPAWNRLYFTNDPSNWFAASTSWYSPAGQSDDWMIIPSINLTNNNYLFWDALSGDASAPETYEVLISTTTTDTSDFTVLTTISGENGDWTSRNFNLAAAGYSNQTVHIAFRNISNDKYLLLIDNIVVTEVFSGDSQMDAITVADKVIQNNTVDITGILSHRGVDILHSIDVSWRANGGAVHTMTISGLNLTYGQTHTFTHNASFVPANAGTVENIEVWVSNPNGMGSSNTDNDTLQKNIFVVSGIGVQRNVLFEEFTTAACQFCPDGHVVMANILAQNPNVIPVSVHSCFGTDAMTNPDASTICSTLGNNIAPTGMVDRIQHEGDAEPAHSRSLWQTRVDDRSLVPSQANLMTSGTYDNTTGTVSIDVDVSFVDYVMSGDIRLSLMIIEDSVSGNGTGWDQINYYNIVPGHPMQGRGNPIVGYQHRHVLRDILPSTWGDASVIPSSPSIDSTYSRNFSFTLNNGYDENQVSFVAVVSYKGTTTDGYEVINANEVKLSDVIVDEGLDIALTSINIPSAVVDGDSVEIKASIKNIDADTLKSFDLNWSIDNGTVHTASFTNLSLAFGDESEFLHSDKAELVGLNSSKTVKVWVTNINGGNDDYSANNTLEKLVLISIPIDAALSSLQIKDVIGNGQNLSVKGEITNKGVDTLNTINVNWTVNGGTVNTETISNLNLSSGQSVSFSHSDLWLANGLGTTNQFKVWIDNSNGAAEINNANDTLSQDVVVASPVDLELETLNVSDTLIKGRTVEIKGTVRNSGAETVNSFVINWVVNGGAVNTETISNVSIPYNVPFNFTHKYKYTPPLSLQGGTLDVYIDEVNSASSQVTANDTISISFVAVVGVYEIPVILDKVIVYPNPANYLTNLDLSLNNSLNIDISIFDISGKMVYQRSYGSLSNGNHTLPIDVSTLQNGLYIMKIQAGDEVLSKKISINH